MKKIRLDSINKKICLLVSIIIVVSLFSISTINYIISKEELFRSNEIILENAINSILIDVNRNYDNSFGETAWMSEEEGKIASLSFISGESMQTVDGVSSASQEEADATSTATVNTVFADHSINLGESGYFFVTDSKGEIVYHPFLNGNIYNLESFDGRFVVQEIISIAQNGGGTLNYALKEDVSVITDSKTVYSKYFPHWDWVVTAVIYDIELARGSSIILANNIFSGIFIFFISIFVTIILSTKITKPIKLITKNLLAVSQGDLTLDRLSIKSKDETKLLADSMNNLIDSLNGIMKKIMESSERLNHYSSELGESTEVVSEASSEIAKAISQMSMQSDQQYRETEDSVERLRLLGENINETAEVSKKVGVQVEENLKLKEMGLSSVNDLRKVAEESNESSLGIKDLVNEINDHSNAIGEITGIIAGVTEQTNLLALNASIEAARAGELGSGFSIVAGEIRKLANETSVATEDIRNKINQMQIKSEEAVRFIAKNESGVVTMNQAVKHTEEIILKIAEGLQSLTENISIITKQNLEINKKKDEVILSLNSVSNSAQENSASIEGISNATEEQAFTVSEVSDSISNLVDMVSDLNNLINMFKIKA